MIGSDSSWMFLDTCGLNEWRNIPPAQLQWTWQELAASEPLVVIGVIVAEQGWFREDFPRGQFTRQSLESIVTVLRRNDAREGGTRVRFGHTDEIGHFVGRIRSPRLSTTTNSEGESVACVRSDMHLAPAAMRSPVGDLLTYVWDMAHDDPGGMSLSMVIDAERIDADGGPDIWIARRISAVDLVDQGAATSRLLSREPPPRRLQLARMKQTIARLRLSA